MTAARARLEVVPPPADHPGSPPVAPDRSGSTRIRPELAGFATPVADLRGYAGNPRVGDVDAIAASLAAHGQYRPIVARLDGEVLAGNHTLEAARLLGWTHIAATRVDVDDDTAARIVLADNRTSDLGRYDSQALAALLGSLPELDGTGWAADDLAALAADLEVAGRSWADRPVRELPEHASCARGQRWRLGPHTLVVGDSRDPASWVGCPPVDMLLTDPPYGIGYDGGASIRRTVIAGDSSGGAAAEVLAGALEAMPLRRGALVYVFTAPGADGVIVQAELVARGLMRWCLVWVKDRATLGRADYQQQHETLAAGIAGDLDDAELLTYGWLPGAPHTPVADRRHTTVVHCPRPRDAKLHPTMKPVPLLEGIVAAHRLPTGSLVADAFAGSGSTIFAAHTQGMTCWAVEDDPRYADVILDRWRDGTGGEPLLDQDWPPEADHHEHFIAPGSGVTTCCGRTPLELPRTDRLSVSEPS